jgi:enolase-phosphatase E1
VSASLALGQIRGILLDIEGTTTPVAFVYEVLFPYARRHLRPHLRQRASSPDYSPLFDRFRDEFKTDLNTGEALPQWVDAPLPARVDSVARYCEWLMDRDRKSTALKELQGRIWADGYARGELVGDVYADVPEALARWHALHVQIGIFSSGSALAQQLLFRHSSAGDLTRFLRWYFDTTIGAKTNSESYRRIAAALTLPPGALLFVSDVTAELDAARAAGMHTVLSMRPGTKPPPNGHRYPVIQSFDALR